MGGGSAPPQAILDGGGGGGKGGERLAVLGRHGFAPRGRAEQGEGGDRSAPDCPPRGLREPPALSLPLYPSSTGQRQIFIFVRFGVCCSSTSFLGPCAASSLCLGCSEGG